MSEKKAKKPALISPKGSAVWPRLTQPDTKFKKEGEYSIKLKLHAAENEEFFDMLQKAYDDNYAQACRTEKKSKLKKADVPWKEEEVDGESTGFNLINFKMTASGVTQEGRAWSQRPSLFDAHGKSLMAQADTIKIGGGSIVKVSFFIKGFYTGALGAGLSVKLLAVQIIKLVEYADKDAKSYGFGQEEGYTASNDHQGEGDESFPEGDGSPDPTDGDGSEF